MSYQDDSTPWSLEWTEELSVGIPEIDAEHRRFIRLVNELNDAIASRMGAAKLNRRMQAVLDDAVAHFQHEAVLFKEWGYPDAPGHEEKHAQITRTLREIMSQLANGGTEYEWVDAGLKIKKTLIDHLLNEDMKCRDYRRKNNVSSNSSRRLR